MATAVDQVIDLIFGRWRSQILAAGTELGIFGHLDTKAPKPPQSLAAAPLLRPQTANSLLSEDASNGFVLTEMGDLLRTTHPASLAPMARLEEGPQRYALWRHLPAMVKDGKQHGCARGRWSVFTGRPR